MEPQIEFKFRLKLSFTRVTPVTEMLKQDLGLERDCKERLFERVDATQKKFKKIKNKSASDFFGMSFNGVLDFSSPFRPLRQALANLQAETQPQKFCGRIFIKRQIPALNV